MTSLLCGYDVFGFGYVVTATFLIAIVRASPQLRPAEPLVWLVVGLTGIPSIVIWTRAASRYGISGRSALPA